MRSSRVPTQFGLFFIIPSVFFLAAVFIYPISLFLSKSVFDPMPTVKHIVHLFDNPVFFRVLWITFRISFTVTLAALLIGYPIAYLLTVVSERARNLLMILVLIPFWTSLLVRTYAWMVLLGRKGVINQILINMGFIETPIKMLYTTFAVNVGMVQMMTPFMVLALFSVMKGIDRGLLLAGGSLGANKFQAFIRIYLPLSMPGIGAGCLLVFIYSLGFFITPALLGGRKDVMLSMLIDEQVSSLLNWGFGAALALMLLLATGVFFFIYTRFFKLEQLG
jgi:ABC-type spermidine/putrescine transport system permease subunit I